MSQSKCSRELYCSFLEVTSDRYSALSLSEVVPDAASLSHDSISRWLAAARVQPKDLWVVAKKELVTAEGACKPGILVFDDVVIDKSRSSKTELVNWQYAGSKHDITKGIGVVNALWQVGRKEYIPMDTVSGIHRKMVRPRMTISGICWPLRSSASLSLRWL